MLDPKCQQILFNLCEIQPNSITKNKLFYGVI